MGQNRTRRKSTAIKTTNLLKKQDKTEAKKFISIKLLEQLDIIKTQKGFTRRGI